MKRYIMMMLRRVLYRPQKFLFYAFLINLGLILIVYLIGFYPPFIKLISFVTRMPLDVAYTALVSWLAIWKIFGIVLFFVPGLTIYLWRNIILWRIYLRRPCDCSNKNKSDKIKQ